MEESSETCSSQETSWVSWFCDIPGNQFLCEVDKTFIEDSFNLFGLKQSISSFNEALEIILDRAEFDLSENQEAVRTAERLYGLIHARFIITGAGLVAMHKKYCKKEFGTCPRTCCESQAVLPVGITDEAARVPVKLFCPKCRDTYNTTSSQHHIIDGAYFGTAFPHMFLLTFEDLVPSSPNFQYIPRIFGFKIHSSSSGNHRGRLGSLANEITQEALAPTKTVTCDAENDVITSSGAIVIEEHQDKKSRKS